MTDPPLFVWRSAIPMQAKPLYFSFQRTADDDRNCTDSHRK
jgi:hypothetical protein